ncbi:MAG: hypothetical protein JXP34_23340 [Planctomycetes bacterium]|nr:hypothetical protein [Planctomycetota bacterium]
METGSDRSRLDALERDLDVFDSKTRRRALRDLAACGPSSLRPPSERTNVHCHTFYSFNAYGHSPSGIAWIGRREGLDVAGIVDFDVLDGLEEALEAGEILGQKMIVGLETRVFIPEYADREINSPGEPGIFYLMGSGFHRLPAAGSEADRILRSMAARARARNEQMMQRINAHLGEVTLDYERDVLPLTPAENATERHLLEAYDRKARQVFGGDGAALAGFWTRILGSAPDEIERLLADRPRLHEVIRAKLMKAGGVGYQAPGRGSFPPLDEAVRMIVELDAVPTATWLDGTSAAEADTPGFFAFLRGRGIAAVQVIPDRNWNIADPARRARVLENLRIAVEAARDLDLPLLAGTEMNKHGQKIVDDFSRPEIAPYVGDFLRGARILYAHALLAHCAGFGMGSPAALAAFGGDARARNDFFAEIGALPPAAPEAIERLGALAGRAEPGAIREALAGR